jgi:hypothetical protein
LGGDNNVGNFVLLVHWAQGSFIWRTKIDGKALLCLNTTPVAAPQGSFRGSKNKNSHPIGWLFFWVFGTVFARNGKHYTL